MIYDNRVPHVQVDIDNSKFELHKKDNIRISKLTQQTDFKRILESKVDINLKIAKILTNALGWKIDFSAFKGCKYSFTLPLENEPAQATNRSQGAKKQVVAITPGGGEIQQTHANNNNIVITAKGLDEEIEEEIKNMSKNQIEDQAVNQSQSQPKKPTGPPPLFLKSTCCGQALLLSLKEMVGVLEDNIGLRCDEAYLEDSAVKHIKDCFRMKKCTCPPYKFIFVDMDDPTIQIKRFMITVNGLLKEHNVTMSVYGVGSNHERSKPHAEAAGAGYIEKPVVADALRTILPH